MPAAFDRSSNQPLHPLHAFLLAGSVPLFLGALLSDWAYWASFEVQWKNFASWFLVGALIFAGSALVWAFGEVVRPGRPRRLLYLLILLAVWLLGFLDLLVHFRDAWASMPYALILSVIVAALAIAASWLGFSTLRSGGVK